MRAGLPWLQNHSADGLQLVNSICRGPCFLLKVPQGLLESHSVPAREVLGCKAAAEGERLIRRLVGPGTLKGAEGPEHPPHAAVDTVPPVLTLYTVSAEVR